MPVNNLAQWRIVLVASGRLEQGMDFAGALVSGSGFVFLPSSVWSDTHVVALNLKFYELLWVFFYSPCSFTITKLIWIFSISREIRKYCHFCSIDQRLWEFKANSGNSAVDIFWLLAWRALWGCWVFGVGLFPHKEHSFNQRGKKSKPTSEAEVSAIRSENNFSEQAELQ